KVGFNRAGTQRWECKDCKSKMTFTGLLGRPKTNTVCEICGQPAQAKGLCPKHYQQMRKKFR
ncbi:MAG TPA: hypothetical protein VFM18_22795, partial [Methanosarcina sp.]|nr:hypothetical protein [Methanosarcina sp.]